MRAQLRSAREEMGRLYDDLARGVRARSIRQPSHHPAKRLCGQRSRVSSAQRATRYRGSLWSWRGWRGWRCSRRAPRHRPSRQRPPSILSSGCKISSPAARSHRMQTVEAAPAAAGAVASRSAAPLPSTACLGSRRRPRATAARYPPPRAAMAPLTASHGTAAARLPRTRARCSTPHRDSATRAACLSPPSRAHRARAGRATRRATSPLPPCESR